MANAYKCDRCHLLYEKSVLPWPGFYLTADDSSGNDGDLCDPCTEAFAKFMNGEAVAPLKVSER